LGRPDLFGARHVQKTHTWEYDSIVLQCLWEIHCLGNNLAGCRFRDRRRSCSKKQTNDNIGRNELRTSQREKSLVPVIWLTPEELKDCSWLVSGVWKLSLACDVTPSSRSRASISSSSLLWISFSFCLSANFAKAWAFLWAIWAFCSSVRPVLP